MTKTWLQRDDAASPQQSLGSAPTLAEVLEVEASAGGFVIADLGAPANDNDAATKLYVDSFTPPPPTLTLAQVLAAGNGTGGFDIVHSPAVNVQAVTTRVATATGTGLAGSYSYANSVNGAAHAETIATATGTGHAYAWPTATTINGDAFASPKATATGSGNTDACTYARSVDGAALADNDAAASGTGDADAGCYAAAVDGTANAAGYATTTGTGVATAGGTATGTGGTAGMVAVADAVSGRMGFNGVTPIAIPELPATPTEQDIADVLVALGLVTQAA